MTENNTQQEGPTFHEKKLYRSRTDKVFAGVAGGFAEYFDLDPIVVRILWLISVFFFGFGLLFYIACAMIIPLNPNSVVPGATPPKSSNIPLIIGAVMIVFGAIMILDEYDIVNRSLFHFNFFPWRLFWPIVLIGIGIYFLANGNTLSKSRENLDNWVGASKLRKSRIHKMLGGVCGGLGKAWNMDPTAVRLLWVLLFFISGPLAIVAYIVALIVMPYDDTEFQEFKTAPGNGQAQQQNGTNGDQ